MANTLPLSKRIFDAAIIMLATPVWIPAILITPIAIFITSGWPIVYLSKRYVLKGSYQTVIKFRTMIKNAEQVANRDTISPEPDKLLNIAIRDELYTPLGKFLEKIHFTELPQLIQVLMGTLTLVGNRPMPENMLEAGRATYPYIEERFSIPSGITGPAQLIGREKLTDKERLQLEITYAYWVQQAYSPLIDLYFLFFTILTALDLYKHPSISQIESILFKHTSPNKVTKIRQQVGRVISK